MSVWLAASSQAVHDNGMFELDGNTTHDSATTPPYDWNSLFDASGNRLIAPDPVNGPLLGSAFVSDSANPDNSYFNSNKDISPIHSGQQAWGCAPINNPLAKDNLLNAYAALVQVPAGAPDNAGHQVLYLGSERGSNNGTSFAGFWLLKDKNVGCQGVSGVSNTPFSGQHEDGDILIISNYTNGGGTQDVTAYRWTGDDASGSLVQIMSLSGGVCTSGSPVDSTCAIANASSITTPWSPTGHLPQTFVETGIDMNDLLGPSGGCFTTFLAETRSSDVLSATLKDFAGGSLSTCVPPTIVTTATPGGDTVAPGAPQHDVATITAAPGKPAPTGTITFSLCGGSDVTSAGCPTGGTQVGSPVTISGGGATSGDVNTAAAKLDPGKYCFRADYTPDAAGSNFYSATSETNATTECFTVVFAHPTITTQISVTGTHAPGLGFTTLGDTATLHGFQAPVTGGSVSFTLYGPFADGVAPTCDAAHAVFSTTGTLDAAGSATTSSTYQPTAAGNYVWIAHYGGNALNDQATGTCTDANESVDIIAAQIDVTKSANPPGPVSAGEPIGFDITVSNQGSVPALGVHVHDALPAGADGVPGGDLTWMLDPPYAGCAITGSSPNQVLDCNFAQVDPGSLPVIHITSATTQFDCGTVKNKATITTTNGTGTDSDWATVSVLCPDLAISKTADAAVVNVGNPIGFTVDISNPGAGVALGVDVNDPLPTGPGITWSIDAATGPLSCGIAANVLTCTGSLASGVHEVVHVTSPTQWTGGGGTPVVNSCLGGPGNDGVYPNTAQVSATNVTKTPSANAQTQVICPDLHIVKEADAAAVNAGTSIGFTIHASNAGPGIATGALVHDPLPTGPAGVTWSIDAAGTSGPLSCSITANVLSCNGTLAAGQTEIVHVVAPTKFVDCGTYDNTATLTATNTPQAPSSEATEDVLCASLVIHKVADPSPVSVGTNIGFTVTVTNNGSGAALGVDVEDPLPAGAGVSWSVDNSTGTLSCSVIGSVPTQTLVCTGDLAAGAVQTVHITSTTEWTADANSCGEYDNTASVTWGNGPAEPISSELAVEIVQCPTLDITKTADAASVSASEQIGFKVEVTNDGPGSATGLMVNDPLPAGPAGSDVSWSIDTQKINGVTTDTCSITGAVGAQSLQCGPYTAAPGFDLVVHILSNTTKADCGTYDNTASYTATNAPGGEDSASTSVLCPNLKITKTADASSVADGLPIGFTVTVNNDNSLGIPIGRAVMVALSDPLPVGPSGSDISWTIDSQQVNGADVDACSIVAGGPTGKELECTFASMAPGDVATVHVSSNTGFVDCGNYDNTATVGASNSDDMSASASTSVICPADSLIVKADAPLVPAGDPVGFTLTGKNAAVVISDARVLAASANARSLTSKSLVIKDLAASSVEPGSVLDAVLTSSLPAGGNLDWKIDPAYTGLGSCAISGSAGSQTLTCNIGTMPPDSQFSVHITSATTCDTSSDPITDKGVLSSSNIPSVSSQDTTAVSACAVVIHRKPPAATGVPVSTELAWAVGLIVGGGIVLMAGVRRRKPGTLNIEE